MSDMGELVCAMCEPGVVYLGYERTVPYNWDTMEPEHTAIAVKPRQIVDGNNDDAPLLEYDHQEVLSFVMYPPEGPIPVFAKTFFGSPAAPPKED